MSYLLFIDESGHDRKNMPYEVRGGICLHSSRLWDFVREVIELEEHTFGCRLQSYKIEIKGHRLLDRDRIRWSDQDRQIEAENRRELAKRFLEKGRMPGQRPSRDEFTAYGQSCLAMANGIFDLLERHGACVFAAAIPRTVKRPSTQDAVELLRKDHVFLFERYFHFLERYQQHGLIVMDETEKLEDRKFVGRMEQYFTRTQNGQQRAGRIIPYPFFVSSDLVYPVQAADLVIYCINWGYRICAGMDSEVRPEIQLAFEERLRRLQFSGDFEKQGLRRIRTYGIFYVPDPYTSRT
ncbi:DUF3800 domain-containing protein [bacterium]|nr:DUF3800 domain-containing protein [bacterium]